MNAFLHKLAAIALIAGALDGCVTFEHAPVSRLRCDSALAGEWQTVKTERLPRPVKVSPDCELHWPEDDGDTYVTTLRGFVLDDDRYLVFSPAEADRLMDMDGDLVERAPAGSVLLVRYRIDGDEVKLWLPSPDEAMKPDATGKVAARQVDDKFAHIEGDRRAVAALLRARGDTLFDTGKADGTTRLKRVSAEASP